MKGNDIELFEWIRKIEFSRLKDYYQKIYGYKNFNNYEMQLFHKYLKFENFENLNLENKFENFVKKFKKNEKFNPEEKNENKNDKYYSLEKIYNVILSIGNELKTFTQGRYNKIRKHKLIYFMSAFVINKNEIYKIWKNPEDVFKSFYPKNRKKAKIEWCAFDNGPILKSIYKIDKNVFDDIDDELILVNNEKNLKAFEIAYLVLRNFSTINLIEESHLTEPWSNNYEKKSYFKKISNNEIVKYFIENKPFFTKYLN